MDSSIELWKSDESRAELEVECGSRGTFIKVFSCNDTLKITFTEYGKLEIE